MCLGGGSSKRAAAAAQAEAQRQFELEQARLRQEAADAKAAADARAAADAARYEAMFQTQRDDAEALRKQLAEQEAFRLSEMARIEADRKAEREAELAQKAERAKQLENYNTNRQGIVDNARGTIEAAFAPFDDSYFSGMASEYVDHYTPQLDQQYDDARKQHKYKLADRGNLRSTAAANRFGRLIQQRGEAANEIAQQGASFAQGARKNVESQRANLLNSIFSAVNAAPVITGDNIGEANSSLSRLSSALSVPVSLAQSPTVTQPSFGQLSQVFSMPTASGRVSQPAGSATRYANSYGGGSGRLVA